MGGGGGSEAIFLASFPIFGAILKGKAFFEESVSTILKLVVARVLNEVFGILGKSRIKFEFKITGGGGILLLKSLWPGYHSFLNAGITTLTSYKRVT